MCDVSAGSESPLLHPQCAHVRERARHRVETTIREWTVQLELEFITLANITMATILGTEVTITIPAASVSHEVAPASQLGTRVPAQDYNQIRRQCLAKHTLFEDPYFPADEKSLFFSQSLPFVLEWKRPGDLCPNPMFISDDASRFDVSQGLLGDCWLVAAIASLTQDHILFNAVVPPNQGWGSGYCGIFHFRFWHFGEWVDIVVDDRLPTHNGKLVFIHSPDSREFWSALLEKAYAKLYGGYESLKGGKTSEAMVDFTGGVVESFDLSKEHKGLYEKIQKHLVHSSLLSCSIKVKGKEDVEAQLPSGLVKGHAYSITGATVVEVHHSAVHLIRLRNPCGQKEWNGDWSDHSSKWKLLPGNKRAEVLGATKDDGEFWMSYEDFCKNFTDFEMCSVSIDHLYEDEAVKSWNASIKSGSWLAADGTAGGCRNNPTFVKNPQYVLELQEDDDGDGKCTCTIALMQKHRRMQKKLGIQELCIGVSVYKAPEDGSLLTKEYVDYHPSVASSGPFTNIREVSMRATLDPGKYIVVPCAFKPAEEGDYLLRIFTEKYSEHRKPSVHDASHDEDPRKAQLRSMFSRIAGEDNEVDAEELQDILTASLSKDMKSAVFSLDACRAMIAMLDADKTGTLNYQEFQTLLETIGEWKKMFFKYDRDRSGTLEKSEVAVALQDLGYALSAQSLNILFNRFSKKRKYMNLDDFAACLSRVKIMSDLYKKMSRGANNVTLTKDQFFLITLDA